MISCIVLSAGLSSRFGSPKALSLINKTPTINFILQKLIQTRLDEIIVVLGAEKEKIELNLFKHTKIRIVYNNDYYLGQLSSIQTGIQFSNQYSQGFMILPVDCPFIEITSTNLLIDHFLTKNPKILIPTFHSQKGHPPVISVNLKEDILKLDTKENLAKFFKNHCHQCQFLEITDPGILQTFNTAEELKKILLENPQFN